MSESRHPEAEVFATINQFFSENLTSNSLNTRRSPFREHPRLDDAQTREQVDARTLRELERRFNLDRPEFQDDLRNDHWSWTSMSYPERTAATSRHPNITPFGGNLCQTLLQEEVTSQKNLPLFITDFHPIDAAAGSSDRAPWLSDTVCYGHDPSFATAVDSLGNSPYSEIHHALSVGNELLVNPTDERNTPLASGHSLVLSDPSLEQGGHKGLQYIVHGTTSAGIAPGKQNPDGRATTTCGETSVQPGQDPGKSCDHNDGPGPDAAFSQTVRQHTHFRSPQSIVRIYKEPAVARTSPQAKNQGDEVGDPSTRYKCTTCKANFYAEKGLTRHIKDRHLKRNVCPFCSTFKWSQGRKYLFKNHLKLRHQAVLQVVVNGLGMM